MIENALAPLTDQLKEWVAATKKGSTERAAIQAGVDRANGHYDRYCGGNGLKIAQNTPCNQYIARHTQQ